MSSPGGVEVGRVSVRVVPDTSRFREDLRRALEQATAGLKADIGASIDATGIRQQLRNTVELASRGIEASIRVRWVPTASILRAELRALVAAAQAGVDAEVRVRFGSRGIAGIGGGGGISPALIAGIALIIAPLVSLVGTLLAALPSLIGLFAALGATVALGMDGIKKAFEPLGPVIENLKKEVSATFEEALFPVVQDLVGLLPKLTNGFKNVAGGLSDFAGGFTSVLASAEGVDQLNFILDQTSEFLQQIRPAAEAGTRAFLTLATAGAEQFDVLGDSINRYAANFEAMVNRITSNGSFASAIEGLALVMDALGDSFIRIFEVGVNFMGYLSGPLAAFIDGFTDLFVGIYPILASLSALVFNVIGAIGTALGPAFAALAGPVQQVADVLGVLLVGAVQAVAPILLAIGQIIGEVLVIALQAITPLIGPLVAGLTAIGQVVGAALIEVFTLIAPLLQLAAAAIGEMLVALTPLIPAIVELVTVALVVFVEILRALMPVLLEVAREIFPLLVEVIRAAVPIVLEIVRAFIEFLPILLQIARFIIENLIPVMQAILRVVQDVWPFIQQIIQGAMEVIRGVIDLVMGIITGDWERAWSGIQQILSGAWRILVNVVQGGIQLVVSFFRNLPSAILGVLGNIGNLLLNAGRSLVDGFLRGIQGAWNGLMGWVRDGMARLRGLWPFSPAKWGPFSGKGYVTYSGKAITSDFAKSLRAGIPGVVSAASSLMASANDAFSAESIGDSLLAGVPDRIRDMESLLPSPGAMTAQMSAEISSDDFGSVGDRVAEALSGWNVELDKNGLARLVNRSNNRKARR
jgi:phage-related protein